MSINWMLGHKPQQCLCPSSETNHEGIKLKDEKGSSNFSLERG